MRKLKIFLALPILLMLICIVVLHYSDLNPEWIVVYILLVWSCLPLSLVMLIHIFVKR